MGPVGRCPSASPYTQVGARGTPSRPGRPPPYERAGVQLVRPGPSPTSLMKLRPASTPATRPCATSPYPVRLPAWCTRPPGTPCSRPSCSANMDEEATPTLAPRARGRPSTGYKAHADRPLLQTRKCATPSPGCARKARTRIPKWLLPVVPPSRLAGGAARSGARRPWVASWGPLRPRASTRRAQPIEVVDRPSADTLTRLARRQRRGPRQLSSPTVERVRGPGRRQALSSPAYRSPRWALACTSPAEPRATLESLV